MKASERVNVDLQAQVKELLEEITSLKKDMEDGASRLNELLEMQNDSETSSTKLMTQIDQLKALNSQKSEINAELKSQLD